MSTPLRASISSLSAQVLRQVPRTVPGSRPAHRSLQQRHFCLHSLPTRSPRSTRILIQNAYLVARRHQSTASSAANAGSSILRFIYGTGLVLVLGFGYLYITDTRASIHQWLVVPALRLIHYDPEDAHHAGIRYIKALYDFGLHPRERGDQDKRLGDLRVEVFGHILDNPIGTSAGIDKNAEIPSALLDLGAAVVEVGGATPLPQEGNPKPRVFRIPSQNALINRYGLNSAGAAHVATQLRERVRAFAHAHGLGLGPAAEQLVLDGAAGVPPGSLVPGKLLLVQIAKNKSTPDADIPAVAADYEAAARHLARYADVLVVNVSSPNTPGLRDLQAVAPLTAILTAVTRAARDPAVTTRAAPPPRVMVKVSPDEDADAQLDGICAAVWAAGVDGVIVGNTTKKRPAPVPAGYRLSAQELRALEEAGGYSGPQLFERTRDLVRRYRERLDRGPPADVEGKAEEERKGGDEGERLRAKVIFATGGITTGEQCLEVLEAGASVCQIYTAMMYGGVGTVTRMKGEMRAALKRDQQERQ